MNADPVPPARRVADAVRRQPLVAIAALAIAAFAVLVGVNAAGTGNLHTGDTDIVAHGARVALHCLKEHTFTRCGLTSPARTDVGPYPLLQYLPAAVLSKLTTSDDTLIRGLARLNFAALLIGLAATWFVARRRAGPAVRTLVVLTMLLSPLWYYSTAGFGEMLSVVALVGVVLAVVERRPVLIFVLATLAGMSKETLPYFAASLGLLVGHRASDRWLPPKRVLVPLASGSVVALAVNTAFNEFRYGQASNPFYLQSLFRVHSPGQVAKDYVTVLFAPNAGIVAFWPVLLIPAALAVAALVRSIRHEALPQRLRWLALIAWPAAFVGTAALWFAPFGWIAWGPRLEVPVLPAWAIAVALCLPAGITAWLDRLTARSAVVVAAAVVAAALALVPAASPWSYGAAIGDLIAADSSCPALTQVAIEKDRSQYFRCLTHFAWRRPGHVLGRSADPPTTAALVGQVLLALAAVSLVADARRPGEPIDDDLEPARDGPPDGRDPPEEGAGGGEPVFDAARVPG